MQVRRRGKRQGEKPMFMRLLKTVFAVGLSVFMVGTAAANAAEVSTSNQAPEGYVAGGDALPAGCIITIPAGAISEGEPNCYDDYIDVTNGGCNSEPPVFGTARCGDIISGTSGMFNDGSYRDTDWFKVEVNGRGTITMSGAAEFPLQFLIIDGRLGCPVFDRSILAYALGDTGVMTTVSASVEPGTYYLWAGPQWGTLVSCGSPYYFEYTCDIEEIPTVSFWGFMALALVMAGSSLFMIRRRKTRA